VSSLHTDWQTATEGNSLQRKQAVGGGRHNMPHSL